MQIKSRPERPRVRKLLDEFKAWCDQRWGRQAAAARSLGLAPQSLTNWFRGVRNPTGEQVLAIQEFLKKAHRLRHDMIE